MKNKKAVLMIIVLFIVLFSVISVDARLGNFRRRACVDIKTILNTSAVNLSTLNYPNTSVAVFNQTMGKSGQTFNYTFCDTETLGVYGYDYMDQEGNVFVNDFIITPDGNQVGTAESMMYIWILIFIVIFLTATITVAIIMPFGNIMEDTRRGRAVVKVSKLKYLKIFAIWISYYLFLTFITVLTGMVNNYVQFEPVKELFTSSYLWLSLFGYGVSFVTVWIIFALLWKDIILNKVILNEGSALLKEI